MAVLGLARASTLERPIHSIVPVSIQCATLNASFTSTRSERSVGAVSASSIAESSLLSQLKLTLTMVFRPMTERYPIAMVAKAEVKITHNMPMISKMFTKTSLVFLYPECRHPRYSIPGNAEGSPPPHSVQQIA